MLKVDGKNANFLVDSGSSKSLVSKERLARINEREYDRVALTRDDNRLLCTANNGTIVVNGKIKLNVYINGYLTCMTFYVVDKLSSQFLLGIDELTRCHTVINLVRNYVIFR
jgi:predicted aspartyl protease